MVKIELPTSTFLRASDLKDGDVLEVVSEGEWRRNRWGRDVFVLDVKAPDGSTKSWSVNLTTLRNLVRAWGDETKAWVGKKVKVTVLEQEVRGRKRKTICGEPAEEREEAFVCPVASCGQTFKSYSEMWRHAFTAHGLREPGEGK